MHPLLQAREGHDFPEIGGCSEPFTLLEAPGFQGPIINGGIQSKYSSMARTKQEFTDTLCLHRICPCAGSASFVRE